MILPEVLGFLDPHRFDFYQNHPERAAIAEVRKKYGIEGIDELWVFCTDDETDDKSSLKLFHNQMVPWIQSLHRPPILRGWTCRGVPDIRNEREARYVRNALFLLVLHAHRRLQDQHTEGAEEPNSSFGRLYISLTGGRKTISADLQDAAMYFGCDLLFHIVDRDLNKHEDLRKLTWENLSSPLPGEKSAVFLPVRIGSYPFLETTILGRDFPEFVISEPDPFKLQVLEPSTELVERIENKTKNALYFHENLFAKGESTLLDRRNFFSIFTLSPSFVKKTRETRIFGDEAEGSPMYRFLRSLPKAELHCHLGGVLDISDAIDLSLSWKKEVDQAYKKYQCFKDWVKQVGEAVRKRNVSKLREAYEKDLDQIQSPLNGSNKEKTKDTNATFSSIPRAFRTAAFLLSFQDNPDLLEEVVYGNFKDPHTFCGIGIERYERMGNIQGSALLQSEEALRRAVQVAVKKARDQNVRYLELRCSPLNYTKGFIKSGLEAYRIIADQLRQEELRDKTERLSTGKVPIRCGIILITSRHRKLSVAYQYIELMEEIYEQGTYAESLVGIDLAGEEKRMPPSRIREAFLPVMDRCQHITIHAGEGEPVDNIWQAVYYLNAERIGHGLTLRENLDLMRKFIDRGIAVELCPSSNHQIVGFYDHEYPLREYLNNGVPVTINTDNPGISRTNLTREYLMAARLCRDSSKGPAGLSIIEVLQIVKNGFSAAFLPLPERERLMFSVEQELYQHSIPLLQEVWGR